MQHAAVIAGISIVGMPAIIEAFKHVEFATTAHETTSFMERVKTVIEQGLNSC